MKVTRTDLHRCYSPISFTVIRSLLPSGKNTPVLLPVTLTPEPDNKIPAPVQAEQINTPTDSLCCELVLPAGTLRLKGELTLALLQTLIREMKGSSH